MIKKCPIVSHREKSWGEEKCLEGACAFWDEQKEQCCIKTIALAIENKSFNNGGSSVTLNPVLTPTYYNTTGTPPKMPYENTLSSNKSPQEINGIDYNFESGM